MFRRLLVRLTLACYSAIALFGQGLHCWTEEGAEACTGHHLAGKASPADLFGHTLQSPDESCRHDGDSCAVCQHQSLSQILVAPAPIENTLDVCEILKSHVRPAVVGPALFSCAQPRAPPLA